MNRQDRIAYLRKEVEYLRQASVNQLNFADLWNTRDPGLFPAAPGMVDAALRKSERYAERVRVLEETLDEYEQALTNSRTLLELHRGALRQWHGLSDSNRAVDGAWIEEADDLEAQMYRGDKAMNESISKWLVEGE